VLGGGIIKAGDDLMKPLRQFVDMYEWQPAGKRSTIVAAHFEEFAGAIGAAGFALQKTFH
ncbi:MAG: ROK family protein, partial [Bacteroidota bacterium]